jgi:hypothetical protein
MNNEPKYIIKNEWFSVIFAALMTLQAACILKRIADVQMALNTTIMEVQLLKAEIETLKENHSEEFDTQAL